MLRSAEWQSFTDVSGRHVGPIFKGREVQQEKKAAKTVAVYTGDFLTLENGTDTLCRNVGKQLPPDAAWFPTRDQT
jgi:hypothetical protein